MCEEGKEKGTDEVGVFVLWRLVVVLLGLGALQVGVRSSLRRSPQSPGPSCFNTMCPGPAAHHAAARSLRRHPGHMRRTLLHNPNLEILQRSG